MEFIATQEFDSGNLASIKQIGEPDFITSKEISEYPRYPAYYFEIECRCDNETSTFKSYFNFLMRPLSSGSSNGLVPNAEFFEGPITSFEPCILVFIWTNPPNTKRLISNLFKATYRFFDVKERREYYQHPDLHDELIGDLRDLDERLILTNEQIPDYEEVFFENTRPARANDAQNQIVFAVVVNPQETEQLVQIAYCPPYPLSHIYYHFGSFKYFVAAFPQRVCVRENAIGNSLLGIPLLGFHFSVGVAKKPVCMLTARVHPGETLSSFVLDGLITSVLNCRIRLLDYYDLYIVPCVNVDGCFLGNYRSDSLSQNLNRAYDETDESKFPINIAIRDIISQIKPRVLIDLHNHASILNAVLFGNDILTDFKQNGINNLRPAAIEQVLNLLFCRLMSKSPFINTSKCDFSYNRMDSEDGRGEGFDGTLRVVAHRELGVRFSYTLETHYFCYESMGKRHFWFIKEFHEIGELLARSLCDFSCLMELKPFLEKICKFLPSGFALKQWFLRGSRLEEEEIREEWEKGLELDGAEE